MEIEFYPTSESDNDRALDLARGIATQAQPHDEVAVVLHKPGRVKVVMIKEKSQPEKPRGLAPTWANMLGNLDDDKL